MKRRIDRHRHLAGTLIALATLAMPAAASAPLQIPPAEVQDPSAGGVRVVDDGLFGNWYPAVRHDGGPTSTVLLLGGSEGGIGGGAARQAKDLAAHGFSVLQLAYFGAPGLPPKLDMVPLEYFDRALAWLKRQPGVDSGRLSIIGASKGAEAALLVAARHPELRAVVVGAPSAAAWPGIDFSGGATGSSWTVRGKPIPYLRYGADATDVLDGYRSGLATLPSHRDAAIPVGRITARVMLVCGRSDALWPSCPMAEIVKRAIGSRATVRAYVDAGHAVFGPPVAPGGPAYQSLGALGGTPLGNNQARTDSWPRVLEFLAR